MCWWTAWHILLTIIYMLPLPFLIWLELLRTTRVWRAEAYAICLYSCKCLKKIHVWWHVLFELFRPSPWIFLIVARGSEMITVAFIYYVLQWNLTAISISNRKVRAIQKPERAGHILRMWTRFYQTWKLVHPNDPKGNSSGWIWKQKPYDGCPRVKNIACFRNQFDRYQKKFISWIYVI